MEAIFVNTENSTTSEPYKFVLNLSQRLNLRKSNEHIAIQNLSIYYTWKNIIKQYKNNKVKMIVPTWIGEFELPNGCYSVSDIPDYIEYIIIIPPIQVYINRINNRLVFKIKDGCKIELQTPETMKLFGSTKKLIDKTKNGEKLPSLEVVNQKCNLVGNQYKRKSEVFRPTFIPNKFYAYLLNGKCLMFLKTCNTAFDELS